MNRILTLSAYQIRILLSEKTWFFLAWALFGLQIAVYGSLMSKLVSTSVPNYLYFYAIGLMVITVFDTSAQVGRHFVEHAHEGELPYFLSLPVSRGGFLASQAIYGIAATIIKVLPPLLGVLWFIGDLTIQGTVFALVSMFLLGLGITGIMVSASFIAFKSVDLYSAFLAGLSALIVRFSTAFYPLIFMPRFYSPISIFSPLTYGADLTRWILGIDTGQLVDPFLAAAVITGVAIGTLSLSARIVDKVIEGVKAA